MMKWEIVAVAQSGSALGVVHCVQPGRSSSSSTVCTPAEAALYTVQQKHCVQPGRSSSSTVHSRSTVQQQQQQPKEINFLPQSLFFSPPSLINRLFAGCKTAGFPKLVLKQEILRSGALLQFSGNIRSFSNESGSIKKKLEILRNIKNYLEILRNI